MYMVKSLLHVQHAIQRTIYDTHAKTGQNQLKLIWKSTISAVWVLYQLFEHNINIYWLTCDVPSANQRLGIKYEK